MYNINPPKKKEQFSNSKYISKKQKSQVPHHTWIMPLIRQTPRVYTTICESSGWSASSSFLTSSRATLWSFDNRSATTEFFLLSESLRPRTALESPRFATYNSSFEIAPTRQHDPTEAICGRAGNALFTKCKNSSSVASNAFFITSTDNPPCSFANSTIKTNNWVWDYVGLNVPRQVPSVQLVAKKMKENNKNAQLIFFFFLF